MSMSDRDGLIWYDGELTPWREANTHVLTHSLHYGMGVFEGVRAYATDRGAAIFRLQAHTDRLFRSAHIVGMPMPYSKEVINQACRQAVSANNLASAYLRPMCFYGSEGMGLRADNLKVHVIVAAWEWGAYLGAENLERGIRIRTSSFSRHHVNVTMCKAKANGNYMNSMLALQEALRDGYDEALLLDTEGYVAEGSGENVFIIRDGVIYTPDLTSALEGITRDTILRFAADLGLPVKEKRITRDEVYIADEDFFTGTAAEVTPIREVDGRAIGSGRRGPITHFIDYRPEYSYVGNAWDAEGSWQVSDTYALTGSSSYDLDSNSPQRYSAGLIIQHNPMYTSFIEVRHLNAQNSTLTDLGAYYMLTSKYEIGTTLTYDLNESQMQGSNLEVRRRFASALLGLNVSYNDITGETGVGFVFQPLGVKGQGRVSGLGASRDPRGQNSRF